MSREQFLPKGYRLPSLNIVVALASVVVGPFSVLIRHSLMSQPIFY